MPKDSLFPEKPKREHSFPSLDLIFELTKERATAQREQANALDNKASFVLGSATALISASLVLQAVTPHPQSTVSLFFCSQLATNKFLQLLPLLVLLVIYSLAMLTAFLAYILRRYKYAPDPEELYKSYLYREELSTKAEVFRAMLEAYRENEKIIRSKLIWIISAFIALGCEVVALAVVLLVQIAC